MSPEYAEDFHPPFWLRSAHLQTLLASIGVREPWIRRRETAFRAASRPFILAAGEGIRLAGHLSCHEAGPSASRPLAVLIHGWLGCHDSRYLRSCGALLFDAGFNVFRLNLRDHGGTEDLNPGLFHSCRIDEVVAALQSLQAQTPAAARFLGGFSLGGNFALRVAARARAAGLEFDHVAAVCPVLDPAATLAALDQGLPIYRHYFLRRWRRGLARKRRLFPDLYGDMQIERSMGLGPLTEYLVCRYAGFPDLQTYLRGYAVVDDALTGIAVRTTLIATDDDPVNPSADLARLARPPSLSIQRLRHGGHCGLVDQLQGPGWADRRMLELFSSSLAGAGAERSRTRAAAAILATAPPGPDA